MRLSDGEWRVMNVVWQRGGSVSSRDVMEAVEADTGWAYTTVKTILTRLATKGALSATKRLNITYFTATVSKQQAQRSAIEQLKEWAFGGLTQPLLLYLCNDMEMTANERDELRRYLEEEQSASTESTTALDPDRGSDDRTAFVNEQTMDDELRGEGEGV